MEDADLKEVVAALGKGMTDANAMPGSRIGPIQAAAVGPLKGYAIDITGVELGPGQPTVLKVHSLRDAKGRNINIVVPAPPPAETRTLLDSIVSLP